MGNLTNLTWCDTPKVSTALGRLMQSKKWHLTYTDTTMWTLPSPTSAHHYALLEGFLQLAETCWFIWENSIMKLQGFRTVNTRTTHIFTLCPPSKCRQALSQNDWMDNWVLLVWSNSLVLKANYLEFKAFVIYVIKEKFRLYTENGDFGAANWFNCGIKTNYLFHCIQPERVLHRGTSFTTVTSIVVEGALAGREWEPLATFITQLLDQASKQRKSYKVLSAAFFLACFFSCDLFLLLLSAGENWFMKEI